MAETNLDGSMSEAEIELDGALCNFCNSARDPFPPASDWNAEVEHNRRQLSKAYNDWVIWLKSSKGRL